MLQQIDQNARNIVPFYTQAADLSAETFKASIKKANEVIACTNKTIQYSKSQVLRVRSGFQTQISQLVERATQQILSRSQSFILSEDEKPSKEQRKSLKIRLTKIYNKIINDQIRTYIDNTKKYAGAMVLQGQRYTLTNILPLYIKIKATVLVSKELILQMIDNQLSDMKMTYSVSKDKVTMLIKGNFDQDKIVEKISTGMENFRELTVKVVKKGLQIQVDKKSLYQNYETFSVKLLEIIRDVREKGAERIVSVKESTAKLYQNVLNRIRQKQISLRMEYKELTDKEEEGEIKEQQAEVQEETQQKNQE